MPSAFSSSKAYSISRRQPSVSGSGSAAKWPNRPWYFACISAAASLHSRAKMRDELASPSHTLGVEIDSTETAIPPLSMASMAWLGCQLVSRS